MLDESPFGVVGDFMFGDILDAGKDLIPETAEPAVTPVTPPKPEDDDNGGIISKTDRGFTFNIFQPERKPKRVKSSGDTATTEEGTPSGKQKPDKE